VQKDQLGEVGNKVIALSWIFQEYIHQTLLKSDSVWPSYGWWKTVMFFWLTV